MYLTMVGSPGDISVQKFIASIPGTTLPFIFSALLALPLAIPRWRATVFLLALLGFLCADFVIGVLNGTLYSLLREFLMT